MRIPLASSGLRDIDIQAAPIIAETAFMVRAHHDLTTELIQFLCDA